MEGTVSALCPIASAPNSPISRCPARFEAVDGIPHQVDGGQLRPPGRDGGAAGCPDWPPE